MPFSGIGSLADWKAETHHFVEPVSTRLPKELACACTASFLVSPIVSILDKAMVKEISGISGFVREISAASGELVKSPRKFFGGLSFRLTFAVYAGTYAVANCSELLLDAYKVANDEQRKPVKVGLSSVANISLLLWRDSIFAREFSGAAPKPSTPFRTLGCFAVRDGATMAATFSWAPKAAQYLQDEYGVEKEVSRISTALAIPFVTQIFTAPIHIHALDYYARPVASMGERLGRIGEEFKKISFARSMRVLPAFGLGSYSNNKFRETFVADQPLHTLVQRRESLLGTVRSGLGGAKIMANSPDQK